MPLPPAAWLQLRPNLPPRAPCPAHSADNQRCAFFPYNDGSGEGYWDCASRCDPACTADVQECAADASGAAYTCRDLCNPACKASEECYLDAGSSLACRSRCPACPATTSCQAKPGGGWACLSNCKPACGDAFTCAASGAGFVCKSKCGTSGCPANSVCLAAGASTWTCQPACSPACLIGYECKQATPGGAYSCIKQQPHVRRPARTIRKDVAAGAALAAGRGRRLAVAGQRDVPR